jgi:hypothetical protein
MYQDQKLYFDLLCGGIFEQDMSNAGNASVANATRRTGRDSSGGQFAMAERRLQTE